jgi:hypothetical protein
MDAALGAGGRVVGVLHSDLVGAGSSPRYCGLLRSGRVVLVSEVWPDLRGFSVGNAMSRNKIVYGLSKAVVIAQSGSAVGGTWAGATEALRKWSVSVFVRRTAEVALVELGATAVDAAALETALLQPLRTRHSPSPPRESVASPATAADLPAPATEVREAARPIGSEWYAQLAAFCGQDGKSRNEIYKFIKQLDLPVGAKECIEAALASRHIERLEGRGGRIRYMAEGVSSHNGLMDSPSSESQHVSLFGT